MGFLEFLTIIFVLLKAFGVISWSWWLVFLPEIIALVLYVLLIILNIKAHKQAEKRFNERWKNI